MTASPLFALPDHAVVVLDGPDATAFAQAQFANDTLALPSGYWQWNAWLTPKGRVIAVFALLKLSEERILLLLPDTDAGELATQLQRFVFRRKLKIAAADELQVSGALRKPDSAESARIDIRDESFELDYADAAQARTLRIAPKQALLDDPALLARWAALDLYAGLPRLPAAQREQWTPQQLSLERLQAFSVKKGCYPGQEIVARTHFLGKAKRGLVLFEADAPLLAGTEVRDGERVAGTLVSVAEGRTALGLAVLPLDREPAPLQARGVGLREVPLRAGLQR
ncbi:MAG: folate-binding protein [Pseudoxanthomonas sp.]